MKLEYRLMKATGPKLMDCHLILHRWDPRDEKFACESFIMQVKEGNIDAVIGTLGFYQDIWRSPSGTVFVAGGLSVLWSDNPVQGGGDWNELADISANRIWGLDETFALAYGDSMGKRMHRFDGARWHDLDAPGWVRDVHGVSQELLYAVGHGMARFNGKGWDPVSTGAGRSFTSIHVVSEDEMYAIMDQQQVWRGSVNGWAPLTEMRGYPALTCIAKWKDRVWVGDSYSGLSVVEGDKLTVVKEKYRPRNIAAEENLLCTHAYGLGETQDGEKYRGFKVDVVIDIMDSQKPVWLEQSTSTGEHAS